MKTNGLTLDQAPPITIPFKFFLTASMFSVAVGIIITIHGDAVFVSRWSPLVLGITHLLTVGFLAQVMIGAMMQLLPVLAGSPILAVKSISWLVHVSLLCGASMMASGFFVINYQVLSFGAILVVFSIALFLFVIVISLLKSGNYQNNVIPIGLGWLAIIPTVAIGLLMVLDLIGIVKVDNLSHLTEVHLSWGILGWVGIVVFATVNQLLPVFYITKESISNEARVIYIAIFSFLFLLTVGYLFDQSKNLQFPIQLVIAGLFVFMSYRVIQVLQNRKRKILDITLVFLWTGLASILFAAIAWLLLENELLVGVLLLGGVCTTVPIGIIYKVIPFLCWYHLQSFNIKQGKLSSGLPSMKHYIRDKEAKRHYAIHVTALILLVLATLKPEELARISGVVYCLSSGYFLKNLLSAISRFHKARQKLVLC
ncbi:MAG: hypothetical protein ABW139_06355 [Candidatus Thiodiazotropha sp. DIVDIV]